VIIRHAVVEYTPHTQATADLGLDKTGGGRESPRLSGGIMMDGTHLDGVTWWGKHDLVCSIPIQD
jgi:hypothetical protein